MSHSSPSGRSPGRTQGDVEYNVQNAALLGASSAFGRKTPAPEQSVKGNGALAAATLAGKRPPAASRSDSASSNSSQDLRLRTHNTGSSVHTTSSPSSAILRSSPGWLDVPEKQLPVARSVSPSNIAATLAAARHLNQTPSSRTASPARSFTSNATLTYVDRPINRLRKAHSTTDGTGGSLPRPQMEHKATDDTPIPPTNSLVKLFEQNNQGRISGRSQPPKSRKPPPLAPKPTSPKTFQGLPIEGPQSPSPIVKAMKAIPPDVAPRRGRPVSRGDDFPRRPSTAIKDPSSPVFRDVPDLKPKPDLPPPRRVAKRQTQDDEPTKSPPIKSPLLKSPPPKPLRKSTSNPTLAETGRRNTLGLGPRTDYQKQSLRQISPHITGDSLANAIVGAHLASSRNHSPTRPSTATHLPPLPRHSPRNHHHHEHNPLNRLRCRSTSPKKTPARKPMTMRTTLRKDESSSSEEDFKHGRRKKHYWRKAPNKHHEGDRKRWRETITERERKRYEGVWAANRGLFIAPSQSTASLSNAGDDVLNLVVREIWSRSRLPASTLAEIWDLVDRKGEGQLDREEFVVGMWLVDQSLKGRKVPNTVQDSVWASVRLTGVKMRKKNFR